MSDLLHTVLAHNYFQFHDSIYHQVQGTAMGTVTAPSYANLFMAELEERLLDESTTDPIIWKRYIDDILCIWPGTPESLKEFIDHLNEAHPTIKFTYECVLDHQCRLPGHHHLQRKQVCTNKQTRLQTLLPTSFSISSTHRHTQIKHSSA